MNANPFKVFVCPKCGDQITRPVHTPRGHYCPKAHEERFVKAEEVEVIPLDSPNVLSVDEAERVRYFGDHTADVLKSGADEQLLGRLSAWVDD